MGLGSGGGALFGCEQGGFGKSQRVTQMPTLVIQPGRLEVMGAHRDLREVGQFSSLQQARATPKSLWAALLMGNPAGQKQRLKYLTLTLQKE